MVHGNIASLKLKYTNNFMTGYMTLSTAVETYRPTKYLISLTGTTATHR